MTAGGHQKYLFDNDFGVDGEAPVPDQSAEPDVSAEPTDEEKGVEVEAVEEAPPPPTYSEEDLARAREEGAQVGREEATRDMASAMEQRLADTLNTINTQVTTLFDAYERDREEHNRDAVGVATVIVRKLFPALNMDKAMAEIEHMIIEAMKRTSSDHTLIIRVPKDMHGDVEEKVAQLAALRGRDGVVNVIADEAMTVGDVAVEWEGGGMVRDTQLIWREIDEIIERNLGQKPAFDAPPQAPVDAPPQTAANAEVEQEVVNPAQVGENEENSVESPGFAPEIEQEIDGDAADRREHDDEPKT